MLFAGHYLDKFIHGQRFNFDLKKHLEVIVIGIVLITTLPVLYKMFFGKKPSSHPERYLTMSLPAVKRNSGIFQCRRDRCRPGLFRGYLRSSPVYNCKKRIHAGGRCHGSQPAGRQQPGDQLADDGLLLGGICWGMLADKKGRLSVFFGSIILYSVANFLTAYVHTVDQYALCRFIAGFGLAGSWVPELRW